MLRIVIISQETCGRLSVYSSILNSLKHKRYHKIWELWQKNGTITAVFVEGVLGRDKPLDTSGRHRPFIGSIKLGVDLRPIGGYAPVGIIDSEFVFWQFIHPRRRFGLYFPQPKVFEYLFYNILVLDESVVRAFLKTCSKARNLRMLKLTEGWKRKPPL